MIKIELSSAYSKLATEEDFKGIDINLPDEWKNKLSKHQVETYKAFLDPNVKVIFNTAMTGDGKSLAAFLPALHGRTFISMLPTNELISDQVENFKNYPNISGLKYKDIYGQQITDVLKTSSYSERWKAIQLLLQHNDIVFTNPDLFHLIMTHQYGGYSPNYNWEAHQLPFNIISIFDYYIFDEFHIYGIHQVNSVNSVINYIESRKTNKKYIFLSATPSNTFLDLLSKSNLNYNVIEGEYTDSIQDGYRQILQEVNLNISWLNQNVKTLDWITSNLNIIKEKYQSSKEFKGAIIVDSILNAKIIFEKIKYEFPELKIIENTGLTSKENKQLFRNKDFDLVVATSTVDIGVDFKINFLIFEAFSQGSFLQRLGRLGRHEGFEDYTAYALIPKTVYEKLEVCNLDTQNEISRTSFNNIIKESFKDYNDFNSYLSKWGRIQSAQLIAYLDKSGDNYKDLKDRFSEKMNNIHFPDNKGSMDSCVKKFWAMLLNKEENLIVEQLNSFRGSGHFECAIYDETDKCIKNYDLFFIIKNTNFKVIEKDEFLGKYDKNKDSDSFFKIKFYVIIHNYKDISEIVYFKYDEYIADDCPQILNEVKVLSGLTIQGVNSSSMNPINRAIAKEKFVCLITNTKPKKLKEKYSLPIHFPIFILKDNDKDEEYSIAFNKEALLLDSILWWRNTNKTGCFIV